jgi:hypothetical protein
MTKILPTIGRVVLFTPSRLTGDYGFAHIDSRKPLAPIVAHVLSLFTGTLIHLMRYASPGESPCVASDWS